MPKTDVFISYSSKDREEARRVKQALEQNGISCWMDQDDILPGRDYAREIPVALARSRIFVLLLSRAAQASPWVYRELGTALELGLEIIPFVLEKFPLDPNYKFYLRNAQAQPAYSDWEQAIQNLVQAVRRILTDESGPPPGANWSLPPETGEAKNPRPFWEKEKKPLRKSGAFAKKGIAIVMGVILTAGLGLGIYAGTAQVRERAAFRASVQEAEDLVSQADYQAALELIGRLQTEEPDNPELAGLYERGAEGYAAQVLARAAELEQTQAYSDALVTLRDGLKLVPGHEEMQAAFDALADANPVPIESTSESEAHFPDEWDTVVSIRKWATENDLDINMNHRAGGIRVGIGDGIAYTFSFVEAEVTSRYAVSLLPANHTETKFCGSIVLSSEMYGSKSRGVIRILLDGVEVFSTGLIDGSCTREFPFELDITGTQTMVFEAQVVLVDTNFIYGIVDP